MDRPVNADRLTTAAQRNLHRTFKDLGTKELPGTGAFPSPSVPKADPVPQTYIQKCCQETAGLPGMPTHLPAQVRLPLPFKLLAQKGPSQSHWDTGTQDQLSTGSFWSLSTPQS